MNVFALAARNLSRNRRRTLLTVGGISIGLGLMHATINFAGGSYGDLLHTAIGSMAGHVVVQGEGYQESRESSKVVTHSGELADQLQAAFPDAHITRRAYLDGLLTSPVNAVGVMLTAVQPEPEAAVSDIDEKVVDGTWLDADPQGLVIGAVMADTLGVGVGDKVVYMGQRGGTDQEGSGDMESRLFRIKGIFKSGAVELDGSVAYSRLEPAQEVLGGEDPATQVALHLADPDDTKAALAKVEGLVARPGLEILPWQVALAELKSFLELDARYTDIMFAIVGLMVAMGVLNTVLMSVLERTRELGVMMAVGMRPGRLARLVLVEGLLLGLLGAGIGLLLGLLFTLPLVHWGVDFSDQLGESYDTAGVPMNTHIYAIWDWSRMATYSGMAVIATVLASVYPAFKTSRLSPVEAIHST